MVIYPVSFQNKHMGKSQIELAFARQLRRLRKESRFTQEQIAEKADLSVRHYQQLESSKPHAVRLVTLAKLAKAFKTTHSKLLDF